MIYSRHSIYPCMSLFVPMEQQVNSKSGGNNSCSRWGKYMSKTREKTLYTLPFQLPMGFKCQLPQEICQSWFALYFLLYLSQNQKCLLTQAVLVEFSFYLLVAAQILSSAFFTSAMEHLLKLSIFGILAFLAFLPFSI